MKRVKQPKITVDSVRRAEELYIRADDRTVDEDKLAEYCCGRTESAAEWGEIAVSLPVASVRLLLHCYMLARHHAAKWKKHEASLKPRERTHWSTPQGVTQPCSCGGEGFYLDRSIISHLVFDPVGKPVAKVGRVADENQKPLNEYRCNKCHQTLKKL